MQEQKLVTLRDIRSATDLSEYQVEKLIKSGVLPKPLPAPPRSKRLWRAADVESALRAL